MSCITIAGFMSQPTSLVLVFSDQASAVNGLKRVLRTLKEKKKNHGKTMN